LEDVQVQHVGGGVVDPPTTVVTATRATAQ
jgi:hypothetical protein